MGEVIKDTPSILILIYIATILTSISRACIPSHYWLYIYSELLPIILVEVIYNLVNIELFSMYNDQHFLYVHV